MYRFKVSKYKNVSPKVPKKEQTITEVPIGQIMASCGDFVSVSAKHIAFNVESAGGGCAGVLPIDTIGRCNRKVPTIYGHSGFLSDMCFSPFDDDLLATCSHDGSVKLWDIPEGFEDTADTPLLKIKPNSETSKLEIVNFHPIADEVLACVALDAVHIIDLNVGQSKHCVDTESGLLIQSMSWKLDGSTMITSCKDSKNRVIDPRAESVTLTFSGFQGPKDSRLVWLGNHDYILGTGFGKQHRRLIGLWDIRNTSSLVYEDELDSASGTLMPFYDIDTNLIIAAGKGDPFVSLYEFNESNRNITFSSSQQLPQQSFGMGMAPKRVLNVMQGEVMRVFQLSKNLITPLPYIIPRKSYRDFHADLFPDTVYSGKPSMNAEEWFSGENKEVIKLGLDPKLGPLKPIVSGLKSKSTTEKKVSTPAAAPEKESSKPTPSTTSKSENENTEKESALPKPIDESTKKADSPKITKPAKPTAGLKGMHQPKFKHLLGEVQHKKNNIENIKNLCESLPSESDGFQGFQDFIAIPLQGAGGQIAVFQLSKPGRLPESEIPVLQNGCGVLDFAMDPFDNKNIAVGCDDWHIRLWKVPEEGLTGTIEEPIAILKGHEQRVTIVKYHPTASNILVSASLDLTIRVWDLTEFSEIGALEGHTDQILCLAWHPDGKYLATFSKDKKIRVYDPVEDVEPMKDGDGPEAVRGARICWCGPNNDWLVISTATGAGRRIFLYDSEDFKQIACTDQLDDSPSVLSLHYDESSRTVFATGKGDSTIFAFEIHEKDPYIHQLSSVRTPKLHQSVVYLQKNLLDVRKIEFARAAQLTRTNIQLISFTVPRVKAEYFQDDLFPDVRVTWEPALTGEDWLDGKNVSQDWISLQPADMKKLSDAPQEAPKVAKYSSTDILSQKTDEEKKSELINAMMGKLELDDKLEQDDFEGVDEDEWDED